MKQDSVIPAMPLVCIIVSEGGIDSLNQFFSQTLPGPELAYVVINCSPQVEDHWWQQVASQTPLSTMKVDAPCTIEEGTVYFLPQDRFIQPIDGRFEWASANPEILFQTQADNFLHLLAQNYKHKAISVLFNDKQDAGREGMKSIRQNGGLILEWPPLDGDDAEATFMVAVDFLIDATLSPDQAVASILGYSDALKKTTPYMGIDNLDPKATASFSKILHLVEESSGLSMSSYNHDHVLTQTLQRLRYHELDTLADYYTKLKDELFEITTLVKRIHYRATFFFEESPLFRLFRELILPQITILTLDNTDENDSIVLPDTLFRLWIPQCSSGEEAYALAMLIDDHFRSLAEQPRMRIIATDLDEANLSVARKGIFSKAAAQGIPEHLKVRYLEPHGNEFHVNKDLRKTIHFFTQNPTESLSFSQLNLIYCRDVLYRYAQEVQASMLSNFSAALQEKGLLLVEEEGINAPTEPYFYPVNHTRMVYSIHPDTTINGLKEAEQASIAEPEAPPFEMEEYALTEEPAQAEPQLEPFDVDDITVALYAEEPDIEVEVYNEEQATDFEVTPEDPPASEDLPEEQPAPDAAPITERIISERILTSNNLPLSNLFPSSNAQPTPINGEQPESEDVQQLLEKSLLTIHTPPSVLVNRDFEIISLHGDVQKYLTLAEGRLPQSLLEATPDVLRKDLKGALIRVFDYKKTLRSKAIQIQIQEQIETVRLQVSPLTEPDSADSLALVAFLYIEQEAESEEEKTTLRNHVSHLESELDVTRNRLQSMIEEFQSSQGDLSGENDRLKNELQSMQAQLVKAQEIAMELENRASTAEEKLSHIHSDQNETDQKVNELQSQNKELLDLNKKLIKKVKTLHSEKHTPSITNGLVSSGDYLPFAEMFAPLSHDVRTAITSIMGFADLLVDRVDEKDSNLVHRITESVNRLSQSINPVLETALSSMQVKIENPDFEKTEPERILIVEDTEDTRNLMYLILSELYPCETAATMEEAIEKAEKEAFMGLVLDINLGRNQQGLEVMRHLRQYPHYKNAPFLAVTALATTENKKHLLHEGFNDFLAKPFHKVQLEDAVKGLFEEVAV